MLKNVGSQKIGAQMVSATDGSAFTGSVTVAVTVDAGTQATGSVGSGACTHEGGGYHTYAPAQAETNGDLIAFTFSGTGAVPVTIQVYTLPTTGVLAPATLGRTLVVDAAGLADANMVKMGPTGSGTAQTARDIGASVLPASGSISRATFAADTGLQTTRSNTAQAGAAGTITLDASASSVTNFYLGQVIYITGGTGVGQSRPIISYDGSTKVATISYDWKTNPDNTSTFAILPPNLFDLHYAALAIDTVDIRTADLQTQIGTAGSGLTSLGDTRLANLNATVSSRLASTSYTAPDNSTISSIASALTTLAAKFTGITLLSHWLGMLAGKQTANTTALTEINATGAGSGTYDPTTDSLEANRDNIGTAGAGLTSADDAVIAAIAALNNLSAAQVWAAGTRTLTALGFTLAASDLAADIITAAKVAADVWTEGRTAINGGDYALSTDANGRIRIVDGTGTGELDTNAGKVLLAATQTFDNTGTWTGNLTGNVGGNIVGNLLGTVAELTTTTRLLPGQVSPSATPTLAEAIMQQYQQSTNPIDQNSSVQRIYNRAGTVVHQKRPAADDGTTASLGLLVAGP